MIFCLFLFLLFQIVLAGDPLQLGPVLRSKLAKQFGLELSFLERLIATPLYERNTDMFADHGSYDPLLVIEPVHEKTNNLDFQPGQTKTRLYSHSIKLEA